MVCSWIRIKQEEAVQIVKRKKIRERIVKLNFLERFFQKRIQTKVSRASGALVVGIPGGVVWPDRNYENFAKETYMKNVIAFRCIDIIAKSVSSVPWKLFRAIDEDTRQSVTDHPMNLVLKRANPRESFTFLIYSHISYLCMAGNGFIEKVAPSLGENKNIVKELYSLRPDRFKISTNEKTGEIIKYIYNVNGQDIFFEVDPVTQRCDILHMKLFHPLDDFWGMAPTEPAAVSVDSHNSSSTWNKNLTENEARPGAIFLFEKPLMDKQFERLQKQIQESREGAKFAGKSMIIEGGKDVKPYGFSPIEMDWLKSNLELARNICNVWGVPPQLAGIPDSATYSNYQEARLAFWEETVTFYLNFLKDEFNHWLFPESYITEQLFLDYQLDNIPALGVKRDAVWARVEAASFLSINEKREAVEYEEIEGGDVVLVPATMLPLGEDIPNDEADALADQVAKDKLKGKGVSAEELERGY